MSSLLSSEETTDAMNCWSRDPFSFVVLSDPFLPQRANISEPMEIRSGRSKIESAGEMVQQMEAEVCVCGVYMTLRAVRCSLADFIPLTEKEAFHPEVWKRWRCILLKISMIKRSL